MRLFDILLFMLLLFQYDSIEWKVQHFYESCKSLDYIESDREKPLMKIVNNLGGWDVLRTFNRYNWDSYRYEIFASPAIFGCVGSL